MADCQAPCELVSMGWSNSQIYARDALTEASNFLALLEAATVAANIPDANVTITPPTVLDATFTLPAQPLDPNIILGDVNPPPELNLGALATLEIPEEPEFLAAYPAVSLPAVPLPLDVAAPGNAPSFTTPALPTAPDELLPDVPTLRELSLPTSPVITLPEFEGVAPLDNIGDLVADFSYEETPYSSTLLTSVSDKLLYDIENGTAGLPVAIEVAIWDRARSRDNVEALRTKQAAVNEFAKRGFSVPNGALAARLQQAEEEAAAKSSTVSRDAAINQAERALQQMQFALTTAVQSEGQLLSYSSQVAQRALEAATTMAQIGIQVFNAKVQAYVARVQAYSAYAEVFRAKTAAELAKLELYKSEIEAQKLIGDINNQALDAYRAQLQGIQTIADIYKTEIEAAAVEASIQKLALDAFRATVESYTAQVQAKQLEYEGYATQIEGELTKIRLFEGEVNAYSSRVDAYKALIDGRAIAVNADLSVDKLQIDKYSADISAYQSRVQAETQIASVQADVFESTVRAYSAEVAGQSELSRSQTEINIANTRNSAIHSEVMLKQADVNIQKALNSTNATLRAMADGATVSAQLAASALTAVNVSAGISGSDSTNYNYSGTI